MDKNPKAAQSCNKTPIEFANSVVDKFKTLWTNLNISNDDFIRTTDERHCRRVKKIFQQIFEKGDIYLGDYEGWYCIPCESFWIESQLEEKKCPECKRAVEKVKEKNYFSDYQNIRKASLNIMINIHILYNLNQEEMNYCID